MNARAAAVLAIPAAALLAACGSPATTGPTATAGVAGATLSPSPATSPSTSATATVLATPTVAATLASTPRCHTSGLAVVGIRSGAAAGTITDEVELANTSGATCQFYGYPGLGLQNASGATLPATVIRGGGMLNPPGPTLFTVAPGGTAYFEIEWNDVPTGNAATPCPQAAKLEITPPDETTLLLVAFGGAPCNGGTMHVSPVHPLPSPKLP